MEIFATLYEFHGRQILVKKGKDSEDNPKLCVITQIGGDEIDFGISFPDTESGWAALDLTFEKEDSLHKMAEGFAEAIKDCKTPMEVAKVIAG
ncbi:hypothetical protein QT13_01760 [Pectobacterium brasiliense]|uniref:hypothetical protein n=1 Tax=Pectobacterium brasiliense TaxID=180957 RepID=UPI00057E30CB|nr:hypothetical protein [Pectobacterium brasiliense]KHS76992.1 hypothetical protein QT13_01760 [Pectobacterium brasiliense]